MQQRDYLHEIKVQVMLCLSRGLHSRQSFPIAVPDSDASFQSRVSNLTVGDLQELAAYLPQDAIQITINPKRFEQPFKKMERLAQERSTIKKMILAGASFPAMNALYGMTPRDVADTRRLHEANDVNGRPAALSHVEHKTVMQLWEQTHAPSIGEKLLMIHQRTDLPINTLWSALQRFI
jgi:hypothetical protein